MKEDNDKRLQQLIDVAPHLPFEPLSGLDEEDFFAYQTLFNQLKTEPGSGLSFAFAANVRRAVELKAALKSSNRFYLAAGLIFVFAAVAGYFLLMLVNKDSGTQALEIIIKYKWPLLMAVLIFIGLQLFNPAAPEEKPAR